MRHVVVVQKIPLQRLDILLGVSVLEANLVVYTGVVHRRIEPPKFTDRMFHGLAAILCGRKFGNNERWTASTLNAVCWQHQHHDRGSQGSRLHR